MTHRFHSGNAISRYTTPGSIRRTNDSASRNGQRIHNTARQRTKSGFESICSTKGMLKNLYIF
jgi:hypothetical protein